jgi:hypothetical protein
MDDKNKINPFSINLNNLYKLEFVKKILKNDGVIYGPFIRRMLLENESFENFAKSKYPIISCYAKYLFLEIFERDLHKYIVNKSFLSPLSLDNVLNKNVLISYDLEIDETAIILNVLYIRATVGYDIVHFEKELDCVLDIDALSINRTGVFCLDLIGNLPTPLLSICNSINKKKFVFLKRINTLSTKFMLKYCENLVKNGYENLDSVLTKIDYDENNKEKFNCSICYENENNSEKKFTQLYCGHIYHEDCLKEAIQVFFDDKKKNLFKCPYCSKKYSEIELI